MRLQPKKHTLRNNRKLQVCLSYICYNREHKQGYNKLLVLLYSSEAHIHIFTYSHIHRHMCQKAQQYGNNCLFCLGELFLQYNKKVYFNDFSNFQVQKFFTSIIGVVKRLTKFRNALLECHIAHWCVTYINTFEYTSLCNLISQY